MALDNKKKGSTAAKKAKSAKNSASVKSAVNKKVNSKKKSAKKKAVKKISRAVFGKNASLAAVLLVLLAVALALFYHQSEAFRDFLHDNGIYTTTSGAQVIPSIDPEGNELAVHYIDVGQGDATLLQTSAGAVLIDCGSKEYGDDILAYLEGEGITELEYLIFTHPHEDHMGCAPAVLRGITVKNVIMNDRTSTTNYFEQTLDAIEELGVNVILAEPDEIITVGALQLRILGPQNSKFSSSDTNNSSIIIHAIYGNRAFLFTGDAEKEAESELVETYGGTLKADVFAAGHHGSSTSNTQKLLDECTPSHIVISCGEGNSYNHPHDEAVQRFENAGAQIHRTDKVGTVIFITDGESLTVK
ncbi:MAG: ComEC/Rec2 family competence protein [Eubacteriales bacterium]